MELKKLKSIVEGILFVSGEEGATLEQLANVVNSSRETVVHIIEELTYEYEHTERGFRVISANGVYHLTTKPEHSPYFKKFLATPHATRLSQAALETIAIIAYEQPITRIEIEEIRGVRSDRALQTLLARSLITEVGRRETVGKPILFGTSKEFLIYFGLTTIDELPPLPENVDEEDVKEEADLYIEQFHEQEETNY